MHPLSQVMGIAVLQGMLDPLHIKVVMRRSRYVMLI